MAKEKIETVTIDNSEALQQNAEQTEEPIVSTESTEILRQTETTTIDNSEALQKIAEQAKEPTVNTESTEILLQTETVVIFRVNRPLMPYEYEELEARVRLENEKSGLKIVLAPYSVDVEITGG